MSIGADEAAGVAALGAAPLIFGLLRNTRSADDEVTVPTPVAPPADDTADAPATEQERRAA